MVANLVWHAEVDDTQESPQDQDEDSDSDSDYDSESSDSDEDSTDSEDSDDDSDDDDNIDQEIAELTGEAIGQVDNDNEIEAPDDAIDEEHTEEPDETVEEADIEEAEPETVEPRRSARLAGKPQQTYQQLNYMSAGANVAARIMYQMNMISKRAIPRNKTPLTKAFSGFNYGYGKAVKAVSFIETFTLKQGLKKFGDKGRTSAMKEMKQLHDREVFRPIHPSKLTPSEKKKVLESLIFLVEKRDGTIKARTCANGSVQRAWMGKDEASSPTVSHEAILLTAAIDAAEERKVITVDIPNAFVQTDVSDDKDGDRICMVVKGPLVDMLIEIEPETYSGKYVMQKGQKVLYLHVKKAIYGMLQSALLFYQKFKADIEEYGFKLNPYDPCVANKMVNGKQLTITWHVDDLKASHVDSAVLEEFVKWLESKYGSKVNKVKVHRGNVHDYLAMILDYRIKGQVKINMTKYVKSMINEFPEPITKSASTPATDKLFAVHDSPELDPVRKEQFHHTVAKALFVSKRARPDIQPTVAFLCTRVQKPNEEDWYKLVRMIKFLYGTPDDCLIIKPDKINVVKWYADAAFAVHQDMKSHTGFNMTMGKGSVISSSRKQKLNTRSSTEAELVAADDTLTSIQWTKLFLEAQGHTPDCVLMQDNKSTMQLEKNGKASSLKRTRHINIRFFTIKDHLDRNEFKLEYCPTDAMTADYLSKPLQGEAFKRHRNSIMGFD